VVLDVAVKTASLAQAADIVVAALATHTFILAAARPAEIDAALRIALFLFEHMVCGHFVVEFAVTGKAAGEHIGSFIGIGQMLNPIILL